MKDGRTMITKLCGARASKLYVQLRHRVGLVTPLETFRNKHSACICLQLVFDISLDNTALYFRIDLIDPSIRNNLKRYTHNG